MKISLYISHSLLVILMMTVAVRLPAQASLSAGHTNLENYIKEALESNEGLKQVRLDYASNLSALKEAKGFFFPEVSIDARYTVADGGRIISFPIGDLLNPVYSTLNILTMSEQFPEVENEAFPFFRPREHETKVRLVQPLFNTDIYHNMKLQQQGAEISRIGIEQYRQELIRDVTKAYYGYIRAFQLNALADTTMELVEENLRVSQSLFDNDLVTKDVVYRSRTEISKMEVQQAQARNFLEASRAYFNFLLNRELSSEIEIGVMAVTDTAIPAEQFSAPDDPVSSSPLSLAEATEMALQNRYELKQLKAYQELNDRQTAFFRGSHLPDLAGVVDYGFQGEDYQFSNEDDFVMASLVFQWTLFKGRTNHEKVQRSQIEADKLQSMYNQAEQQISLDVINTYYALQAAMESERSARTQLQLARKAYTLVLRKYQEGQASLLELIDARTGLTSASSNVIIARTDYYTGLADFQFAIGQNTYQ